MAGVFFKVILFFRVPRGGWSETYYTEADTLEIAGQNTFQLTQERNNLLIEPARLIAFRLSQDGTPRNSILSGVDVAPGFQSGTQQSDTPWQTQLVRLRSTTTGVGRSIYLRGIPDEMWNLTDPNNPTALQWRDRFYSQFAPILKNGDWFIKSRPQIGDVPRQEIAGWVPDLNIENQTLVTTTAPSNVTAGDKITAYKIKGFTPAPGLLEVISSTPTIGTFAVRIHTKNTFQYQQGGYFLKYQPFFSQVNSAVLGPIVHRDTGRPFDLQRGRRRAIPR
jgi:hypothetical protein